MSDHTEEAFTRFVEAQREMLDAMRRDIDETMMLHVEEHHELTPVRPPPAEPTSCSELFDRVFREVARDDGGVRRVESAGMIPWTTYQVPTSPADVGTYAVTYHGDPPFPSGLGSQDRFLSVGAYRSAGLVHGNVNARYDRFIVMPNAMEPGTVFRDGVDQYGKMKWGYRSYDDEETKWLNGYLDGGGTVDGISATKEHAIYDSPNGNVEFGYLLIEDWGGQGIQVASRPWDQGAHNKAWKDGDTLWFHDLCLHENGRNLGRASFPLTIAFNRQTDASDGYQPHRANVMIESIHIRSTEYGSDKWHDGKQIHAKGGILVRGSDEDPNGHTFEKVVVSDVKFDLKDSDRALMDFRNIAELVVERCDASNVTGNRKVELRNVGALEWTGSQMMANVNIRYEGTTVGDGAETFVLVEGVRQ